MNFVVFLSQLSDDFLADPVLLGTIFFIITAILLFFAVKIFLYEQHKKRIQIVHFKSPKIKNIKQLNGKFSFYSLEKEYKYIHSCNSKHSFEKINCDDVFIEFALQEKDFLYELIFQTEYNHTEYKLYETEYYNIINALDSFDLRKKYSFFQHYEITECNHIQLTPVTNVNFKMYCQYTSPAGRKHYSKCRSYSIKDLKNALKHAESMNTYQAQRNIERSKMTQALRYDIMKRDGFKCVLCGATAAEGAKLHVDHILPVAKGGKTIKSNLRTLCEDCNMGKSDKYDPYGRN